MPEPTPNPAKGVPLFPPGDKDRGVSREDNEKIGYGPADPDTTRRILDNAQQATNERGAASARAEHPDTKREAELIVKRESGQTLDHDEELFLARMRAQRERRGT
jgi:hypothetical protein